MPRYAPHDYGDAPWIHAVQGASMLDWPGRTSAVLFLSGCNLGCPYCHNPELRRGQDGAVRMDEAVSRLASRRSWVSSAVVTGGEPLVFPHLEDLLGNLRAAGIATALNTNGTEPARLARLLGDGLLDRVNLDLKAPPHGYGSLPGLPVRAQEIRASLAFLTAHSVVHPDFEMECRTTLDRRYVSSAEDVGDIVGMLAGTGQRLVLQAARGEGTEAHAITGDEARGWLSGIPEGRRPELRGF